MPYITGQEYELLGLEPYKWTCVSDTGSGYMRDNGNRYTHQIQMQTYIANTKSYVTLTMRGWANDYYFEDPAEALLFKLTFL